MGQSSILDQATAARRPVRLSAQNVGGSLDDGRLMATRIWHYADVLQSSSFPEQIYTGQTENIRRRLQEHDAGKVPHTAKYLTWDIRCATAFREKGRAIAFERSLKS